MKTFITVGIILACLIVAGYKLAESWANDILIERLLGSQDFSEVFIDGRGRLTVSDKRVTPSTIANYRLPLKQEVVDDELFELMQKAEGYGRTDKLKGYAKAALSIFFGDGLVGGSTIDTSVAGSMLGFRKSADTLPSKAIRRIEEEWLALYIRKSLSEHEQRVLILNEACGYGNVVGCTLTASSLFGRPAKTFRERVVLLATVRWPATAANSERLSEYANRLCLRFREEYQARDCNFNRDDFVGQRAIEYPAVLEQAIIAPSLDLKDKLFSVKKISNVAADVAAEISIYKDGEQLLLMSNQPYIVANKGFSEGYNIASGAKFFAFLVPVAYSDEIIDAMATSDGEALLRLMRQSQNPTSLGLEIDRVLFSIDPSIAHKGHALEDLATGGYNASSRSLHQVLAYLGKNIESQDSVARRALSAAINANNGTLHYAKQMVPTKFTVLVAKSGTHSAGERTLGKLALFAVKNHDEGLFTIVVRMHGNPICKGSGCSNKISQELVVLAFYLLENLQKEEVNNG